MGKVRVTDNEGNIYLMPESKAARFEELIEIEKELGNQFSEVLANELGKYVRYLVEDNHG